MKTYEEKSRELMQWYFQATEWYKNSKQPDPLGLDGEDNAKYQEIMHEYRQKQRALKKKYGKE